MRILLLGLLLLCKQNPLVWGQDAGDGGGNGNEEIEISDDVYRMIKEYMGDEDKATTVKVYTSLSSEMGLTARSTLPIHILSKNQVSAAYCQTLGTSHVGDQFTILSSEKRQSDNMYQTEVNLILVPEHVTVTSLYSKRGLTCYVLDKKNTLYPFLMRIADKLGENSVYPVPSTQKQDWRDHNKYITESSVLTVLFAISIVVTFVVIFIVFVILVCAQRRKRMNKYK